MQTLSIIIPCYNEEYDYLKRCVDSIVNAEGDKQIILVDNNSNLSETLKAIEEYKKMGEVLVLNEKRQGKRFAHSKGLEYAEGEVVVFVDSDTIVLRNSFTELLKPFSDAHIGAVSGNVTLANRDENFLTKCINAMYWTSSNIFRKSTTAAGYMQVIPGALGAYRKSLLIELEHDYLNQKFLGRPCAISDDRFLTMRIQSRFGKKIEYACGAIGLTYSPTTIAGFWKQFERWRRGVFREVFTIWKEPKNNIKLLFFDVQFNFVIITLMTFFKIFLIYNLIVNFSIGAVLGLMLWFFVMSSMYSSYMLVYNLKEFPYKIAYSFMYEFLFVFTYFHALYNIRKQGKWSTR